jgi:G3E family GTPase
MTSVSIDEHVNVIAVTGFLGAGKTTLIKALLDAEDATGTAVIVSEFGELGIDDAILADGGDGIVELQNGCICCRTGSSMEQTLRDLFVARLRGHVSPFHRLFVETSGMSDPLDLVAILHSRPVREMRYRMQGTIAAFDCQFGLRNFDASAEARSQLAAADCVVLTKSDIGGGDAFAGIVPGCNPGTPILRGASGLDGDGRPVLQSAAAQVELTPALSAFRAVLSEDGRPAGRHAGVRSISIVLPGDVDWTKLSEALESLAERDDASLMRVKGILSVEGIDAPVVVHGVRGALYPPSQLREWPFPRGESRVVLIYADHDGAGFERAARAALAAAVVRTPQPESAHAA